MTAKTHASSSTETTSERLRGWLLPLAWLRALVATVGSLYFSEVMGYVPCNMCWYQRILMYPLVAVFTVRMTFLACSTLLCLRLCSSAGGM